jgi:gas vesicle protein
MQLELIVQDATLEACVTDNSRAMAAMIAGAVIGGVAGYVLFSERGRELRRQMEPALDNFSRELNSFRLTIQKAAGVATEGWKLLNEAMESGSQTSRYPTVHQKSPF